MIQAPNRAVKGATWCGPYALATISGLTYEAAYEKVLKVLKCKSIKGLYSPQFRDVAQKLGYKNFEWVWLSKRTPLKNFMDNLNPNRLYVVLVTGHYVTVNTKDWTVVCNQRPTWTPISEAKMKQRRVKAYAEVKRIES